MPTSACILFLSFLRYDLFGICHYLGKGNAFQFVLLCRLYGGKSAVHNLMDIASYWALGIGVLMETEQPLVVYALDRFVNIIQRDLIQRSGKVWAAAALTGSYNARTSELRKDIAYDDSVHTCTSRQKIAGHTHLLAENINTGQNVNRRCKFTGHL